MVRRRYRAPVRAPLFRRFLCGSGASTCVPVWLPSVITDSFVLFSGILAYWRMTGDGLFGYVSIPSFNSIEMSMISMLHLGPEAKQATPASPSYPRLHTCHHVELEKNISLYNNST